MVHPPRRREWLVREQRRMPRAPRQARCPRRSRSSRNHGPPAPNAHRSSPIRNTPPTDSQAASAALRRSFDLLHVEPVYVPPAAAQIAAASRAQLARDRKATAVAASVVTRTRSATANIGRRGVTSLGAHRHTGGAALDPAG